MFATAVLGLTAAVATGQPTTVSKSATKGAATSRSQTLTGTVVQVEGNTLAVKLSSGEVRMFTPPPDRRFMIDGKSLTLAELQPGTKLTATVTETSTPVVDRTVEQLTGKVWYAAGPTVILTLANGENKMYTVPANSPVKFTNSDGKPITVFDLRKDMTVSATRITEAPRTELATATAVTGSASAGGAMASTASGGGATAAPSSSAAGTPAASASAAGRASAPTSSASTGAARTLPKTASPLPLLGLVGLVSAMAGLGLSIRRRRA